MVTRFFNVDAPETDEVAFPKSPWEGWDSDEKFDSSDCISSVQVFTPAVCPQVFAPPGFRASKLMTPSITQHFVLCPLRFSVPDFYGLGPFHCCQSVAVSPQLSSLRGTGWGLHSAYEPLPRRTGCP